MSPCPSHPALVALLTLCAAGFIAATTLIAKALGTGVIDVQLDRASGPD